MQIWLIVGIGGFIGAVSRYLASGWFQNSFTTFPVGTLGVNVLGSFLLGFVMYLSEYGGVFSEETRILLTIGVMGAFTTMSTFSYESFRMLEHNELLLFGANLLMTVTFTLLAVYVGKVCAGFLESMA
ncbi:fluoride efflux transporter CrcB [Methanogenium cariaci]|jgi:fluoride exporter|uniref:fluoride efflux transporter CrcB n=1 Tax=Methanogenium cariaci TaxID=2197 RepID=UPI000783024D|nr:fluoride efflux transporter CrcB [Methanogenium cariaci]